MFSHPAAISYSQQANNTPPPRKPSELMKFPNFPTPNTPSTSSSKMMDFNWTCQIEILSALQGTVHNYDSRHKIASSIEAMDAVTRLNLIDFLFTENGVIASTLENNACKHFQCPQEQLEGILDEDCLDLFIDFWENIYLHILPNFFGMVYVLEKYNPNIQLRKKFLIHFRDKVLIRVLSDVNFTERNVQLLYPLLFAIDIQTMSNTKNYWKFKTLMNKLMGIEAMATRRLTVLSDDQDFLPPLPNLPQRLPSTSNSSRLNRQTSEITISTIEMSAANSHARQTSLNETNNKERLSTLSPKRSVHFSDDVEYDFDESSTVHV